jgi:hypothetical protein
MTYFASPVDPPLVPPEPNAKIMICMGFMVHDFAAFHYSPNKTYQN